MYYDRTYRGEIVPQLWNTPKHLRYKNGRLGGKDPEFIRAYTTPLPKGLHRECPEQRYFMIASVDLADERLQRLLGRSAARGASHEELESLYETYLRNQR